MTVARCCTWAVILVALNGPASADSSLAPVVPQASTLVLSKREPAPAIQATFAGRAAISGTLLAVWDRKADGGYGDARFELHPDPASAAALPHYTGYGVRKIDVVNGRHALAMAAGGERSRRFLEQRVPRLSVAGVFHVTGYSMKVECNALWVEASVVSTQVPDPTAAGRVPVIETC